MFSNLLPSSTTLFTISYSEYAKKHFLKDFEKKYKGKQWEKTELSFFEDLKRLRVINNTTQQSNQIDQLKHNGEYWLFKYDFRIAQTNESAKASGNRIIGFIDNKSNRMEILLIYNKNDLPKNKSETAYIYDTVEAVYPDIHSLFGK